MRIKEHISSIEKILQPYNCKLLVVSKNQPMSQLQEAYQAGQRMFGENRALELREKWEAMPKDVQWHMIGTLQTKKVKYISPFISLIHSVDSLKLLSIIDKAGRKEQRNIACLLQIRISNDDAKHGMSEEEAIHVIENACSFKHITIKGLMGMASLTNDTSKVLQEFTALQQLYQMLKEKSNKPYNVNMEELSMGMSGDYVLALKRGSTLVRIGKSIFNNDN